MDYFAYIKWPHSRGNGLVNIPYMEHLGMLIFRGVFSNPTPKKSHHKKPSPSDQQQKKTSAPDGGMVLEAWVCCTQHLTLRRTATNFDAAEGEGEPVNLKTYLQKVFFSPIFRCRESQVWKNLQKCDDWNSGVRG